MILFIKFTTSGDTEWDMIYLEPYSRDKFATERHVGVNLKTLQILKTRFKKRIFLD